MDIEELAMLLQTMDNAPVSPEQFKQASLVVRSGAIPLEQDQQLMLYALFKQASEGDAPDEAPPSADPTAPYKHKAWKSVKGFPKEGAAKVYIYLVEDLRSRSTESKSEAPGAQGFGCVFSTLIAGNGTTEANWSESEKLFSAIEAGSVEQVESLLASCAADVNQPNQEGLTPLHYAADRGLTDICQVLLGAGAAVNAKDGSGLSPLHYAALCDHVAVGRMLVAAGAETRDVLAEDDLSEDFVALLHG